MWISILTGASISLRWRCGIFARAWPLTAVTGTTFRDPLCFHSVCSSRPVSALYNQFLVLECPQDLCARLVHVAHQQQVNMLEAAEARGENVDLMRSILEETFAHKLEILEDPEQNVARYFFLTKVRILFILSLGLAERLSEPRRPMLQMIAEVTNLCDTNHSGQVDKEEFLASAGTLVEAALRILEDMHRKEITGLF